VCVTYTDVRDVIDDWDAYWAVETAWRSTSELYEEIISILCCQVVSVTSVFWLSSLSVLSAVGSRVTGTSLLSIITSHVVLCIMPSVLWRYVPRRILYDHYLPTVILIIIGIPSPTHSFTLGLNTSFSANPPYRSLSFLSFKIHYMDFPDCLLLLLSISVFFLLFSFFFCFYTYLVVGSVRTLK